MAPDLSGLGIVFSIIAGACIVLPIAGALVGLATAAKLAGRVHPGEGAFVGAVTGISGIGLLFAFHLSIAVFDLPDLPGGVWWASVVVIPLAGVLAPIWLVRLMNGNRAAARDA